MKKLLVLVLLSVFCVLPTFADRDVMIEKKDLPEVTQKFINKYFAGIDISYVKKEIEIVMVKSYDVILTNGVKLEFDSKGEWDNVDCKNTAVPEGIVPVSIRDYVKSKFPSNFIVEIDKDTFGYEVKLDNGLEIEFDKNGKFKSIDD